MAILQCNKCANLFHDDAPHECDVERWQRLAHEGQQYFGRAIGNAPKPVIEPIPPGPYVEPRFDPKPATPEPPEWRNETVAPPAALEGMTWFDTSTCMVMERVNAEWVLCEDNLELFSPLDRALEDFTARRKAKRERAEALERAGAHIPYAETTRINKVASDIARAMSTPLPHDPPMSARLMPWRGKD